MTATIIFHFPATQNPTSTNIKENKKYGIYFRAIKIFL